MTAMSLFAKSRLWVQPACRSLCKPCLGGLAAFASTAAAPTKRDHRSSTQAYTSLFLQEWRKEVKVGPPLVHIPSVLEESGNNVDESAAMNEQIVLATRLGGVGVTSTSGTKRESVFTRTDEEDPPFYYDGEWKNELPDGFGQLSSLDGEDYRGHFVQGKRTGHGQKRNPNGYTYDGMYVDNQPHGYGIARYGNGSVYCGEFVGGRRHGWGRAVSGYGLAKERYWPCGVEDKDRPVREETSSKKQKQKQRKVDLYDGEWLHGARSGLGRMEWKRGDAYVGHWLEGRCDGPGTFTAADGTIWQGTWSRNALTANFCAVTIPDETRYEGFFEIDAAGIWALMTKGARTDRMTMPTGTGTIFYPDGSSYRGDIVNGKRQGKGVGEKAQGGAHHDGAWQSDVPHALVAAE